MCPAMRFAALRPIVMKLGTVVGAEGPRFGSNFTRWPEVKGQVNFQIAPIELKLGESNAGCRVSKTQVSLALWCYPGAKGQVAFQIAPIELKLGEVNPGRGLSRPYTKKQAI